MDRKPNGRNATPAKTARASGSKAPPASAPAVAAMSPENLQVELEPEIDGISEVVVRYHGPLAQRAALFVRFGERRAGRDWLEPRDVAMSHLGAEAWATISCRGGTTLQGGCFAFHAPEAGSGAEQVWDNAGHPLGYYAFDARTGAVEAR